MKIENPKGMSVHIDEHNKVWLHFDCENGNAACLTIESIAEKSSPIVKRNLLQWEQQIVSS